MRELLLCLLLLTSGAAWAQNAAQGKITYEQNCYICHGAPSASNANAKAANNPDAIRQGIASNVGGMTFLSTLRDSQLIDIAAYIGATLGVSAKTDTDRILDWAEASFPDLFFPVATTQASGEYSYRFYSGSGIYAGSAAGNMLWLGPPTNGAVIDLGNLSDWLPKAAASGF